MARGPALAGSRDKGQGRLAIRSMSRGRQCAANAAEVENLVCPGDQLGRRACSCGSGGSGNSSKSWGGHTPSSAIFFHRVDERNSC